MVNENKSYWCKIHLKVLSEILYGQHGFMAKLAFHYEKKSKNEGLPRFNSKIGLCNIPFCYFILVSFGFKIIRFKGPVLQEGDRGTMVSPPYVSAK